MSLALLDTRSRFWKYGPFYSEAILFPNTFFFGLTVTFGRPFWFAIGAGIIRLTVGVDAAQLAAHMPTTKNLETKDTPTNSLVAV